MAFVPPMFMRTADGGLWPIPEADAAVLDRYREPETVVQLDDADVVARYSYDTPLVFEPQYTGDPFPLYPLIDEINERGGYTCYPVPGTFTQRSDGSVVQDVAATLRPPVATVQAVAA